MARRKIATSDILTDIPELEEGQRFARVLGTRGKNVHEVQFSDNQELLVNLPPKFRSLVWVKRGSYVIIEPAEEEDKTKVGGDIIAVLFPDHIKHYKQQGIWPFTDRLSQSLHNDSDSEKEDGENEDDDLFRNNNRVVIEESDSESESEESETETETESESEESESESEEESEEESDEEEDVSKARK
ncbi:putative RNA-binding protein eif1ad [Linnemannia gamsii]|uniref:RNA-binding protein eif1ad n=1 Tax=Linnemannia gamsii TaxID=64522 RepID=A0ABQ7K2A3_9FUNG|nr:putative RNA-binding protein eif1ad [Linnemannia gamsii]